MLTPDLGVPDFRIVDVSFYHLLTIWSMTLFLEQLNKLKQHLKSEALGIVKSSQIEGKLKKTKAITHQTRGELIMPQRVWYCE